MVMRLPLAASWLCLALLGACGSPTKAALTEILLVVDTDLPTPSELDEINMSIVGPSGSKKTASARLGNGEAPPPRSLGLVHESGRLAPVDVLVQGKLKGVTVLERKATLAFVKGQTLVLPMHLVGACIGVTCESEQTCTEDGCKSIGIDPASLATWTGEKPRLGSDQDSGGGSLDSGMNRLDSGQDAGGVDANVPSDAGADAGMCTPTAEVCNGVDDDCNGVVDDGFDLMTDPDHCGSCPNACKGPGPNRTCCAGICKRDCA